MNRTRLLLGLGAMIALLIVGAAAPVARADEPLASFRGTASGRQFLGPVELHAGLVVIRARHTGNQNFITGLVLPKPGVDPTFEYAEAYGMINVIGQYNGAAATSIRTGGSYLIQVEASGTYQLSVEQPGYGPVETAGQRTFAGRGQQVSPIFTLPEGPTRITLTHDGSSNFQVWLYDLDGATVSGDLFGRLVNEIGPYTTTVELEIVLSSPTLFHINADGNWTIRVQ